MKKSPNKQAGFFERFSSTVTKSAGSTPAFITAFAIVLIWALTGPVFNYSEEWQLIINTGTTIITFLMVFLIQKSQNKDSLAIQLKLNELVAAHELASNRLVDVESLTEEEMKVIQKYYTKLNEITKKDVSLRQTHSIEEANDNQDEKRKRSRRKTRKPRTNRQIESNHAEKIKP